jgi:hypothetical protein
MTEDFQGHYLTTRDGMLKKRVGEQAQRVLEAFMKLSFLADRLTAPVARLDELADATLIHPGNLRRVIDELVEAKVVEEQAHGEWLVYEVRPDWQQWLLPMRNRPEKEQRAEAALKRMIAAAANDPEQMKLRMAIEEDELSENSRAFAPVVRRTSEQAESIVPGTSGAVVRGTSDRSYEVRVPREGPVVRGTSDPPFKALGVVQESNDFKAPRALGVEGATPWEPGEESGESRSSADDPDFEILLERMWRVIPDQREQYAGGWINRARCCPRAMRMAVDKWLESPPKKLKTTSWQWLRAEYISTAYALGLGDKLSLQDQDRRGWWKRLSGRVTATLWL